MIIDDDILKDENVAYFLINLRNLLGIIRNLKKNARVVIVNSRKI